MHFIKRSKTDEAKKNEENEETYERIILFNTQRKGGVHLSRLYDTPSIGEDADLPV
jgi:hypothetical protein